VEKNDETFVLNIRSERPFMSYLHTRNISLISFSAFIWSIYLSIQGQFLNDYVATISGYTPLKISLMVSLVALTGALSSIFFGAISDNYHGNLGRRRLFILIGGIVSSLLFFLFPLSQAIIYIMALNVVMSIFNSAAFVCNNSFIPDISSERKLGRINAFASIGSSLGTIAGFAIMIIKSSSVVFFVTGTITAIGFLLTGLFIQEPPTKQRNQKWSQAIKETFQLAQLRKEKHFFSFFVSHLLLHIGINTYMPFLMIFLTQKNDSTSGELIGLGLSVTTGEVLIVFSIMTIISLIMTIPFGLLIDKTNTRHFLLIARVLFAIATALLSLTPLINSFSPVVIALLFIIPFSIANTADIISRGKFMHQLAPEKKRGQFLGLIFFAKIIAQIPGVIIGGLLANYYQRGYQLSFIFGGIFLLMSIPFIYFAKEHSVLTSKKDQKIIPTSSS
jgi:MFS family permease